MSKNYDIKTVSEYLIGSTGMSGRALLGSSVAAGMTRYVTFIRVAPLRVTASGATKLFLCSAAAATSTLTAASANQKMVVFIASATAAPSQSIPAAPDTEHPLFTIAAGKYLTGFINSTSGMSSPVQVFAQYYDE